MKTVEHQKTNKNIKIIQRKRKITYKEMIIRFRTDFSKIIPRNDGITSLNHGRQK